MSSSEALKAGLRGKALRITHHYRDLLWDSAEGRFAPNAGFLEDVVFEDPAFLSSRQESISREGPSKVSNDGEDSAEDEDVTESVDEVNPDSIQMGNMEGSNESSNKLVADIGTLTVADDVSAEGSNVEEQHPVTSADVDALLDKCLLQALHTTIKDKDLPMPGSTLW